MKRPVHIYIFCIYIYMLCMYIYTLSRKSSEWQRHISEIRISIIRANKTYRVWISIRVIMHFHNSLLENCKVRCGSPTSKDSSNFLTKMTLSEHIRRWDANILYDDMPTCMNMRAWEYIWWHATIYKMITLCSNDTVACECKMMICEHWTW
jgi:hypothetical protein